LSLPRVGLGILQRSQKKNKSSGTAKVPAELRQAWTKNHCFEIHNHIHRLEQRTKVKQWITPPL